MATNLGSRNLQCVGAAEFTYSGFCLTPRNIEVCLEAVTEKHVICLTTPNYWSLQDLRYFGKVLEELINRFPKDVVPTLEKYIISWWSEIQQQCINQLLNKSYGLAGYVNLTFILNTCAPRSRDLRANHPALGETVNLSVKGNRDFPLTKPNSEQLQTARLQLLNVQNNIQAHRFREDL